MLMLLLPGYPLVAHWSALNGHPQLALYWIAAILAVMALRAGSRILAVGQAAAAMVLVWVTVAYGETLAPLIFRLTPILVLLAFAGLLGRTLLPDREPLIVRIGRMVSDRLSPAEEAYGRALTVFWTVFLTGMALESTLLALLADPWLWSLFTNVLNHVLIALAFILEYALRRRLLRDETHAPFLDYLRKVVATRLASAPAIADKPRCGCDTRST